MLLSASLGSLRNGWDYGSFATLNANLDFSMRGATSPSIDEGGEAAQNVAASKFRTRHDDEKNSVDFVLRDLDVRRGGGTGKDQSDGGRPDESTHAASAGCVVHDGPG